MEAAAYNKLERIIGGNLEGCLAMSIEEAGDDRCVLRMPAADNALNAIARVHGGAITALVDTAATGAAWARDGLTKAARGATVSLTATFYCQCTRRISHRRCPGQTPRPHHGISVGKYRG